MAYKGIISTKLNLISGSDIALQSHTIQLLLKKTKTRLRKGGREQKRERKCKGRREVEGWIEAGEAGRRKREEG